MIHNAVLLNWFCDSLYILKRFPDVSKFNILFYHLMLEQRWGADYKNNERIWQNETVVAVFTAEEQVMQASLIMFAVASLSCVGASPLARNYWITGTILYALNVYTAPQLISPVQYDSSSRYSQIRQISVARIFAKSIKGKIFNYQFMLG
jgi:hypothetical protein